MSRKNEKNLNRIVLVNNKNVILSERQFQCLSLVSIGKSSKEIAKILNLSFRTVDTHIEAVKVKFDCRRRSEVILIGIKNNLDKEALLILKSFGDQ